MTGRPPYKWTEEIEAEIFERLGKGQSLVEICKDDWLPGQNTVYKRLADDAEFAKRYSRAREVQADTLFDEMLQIADDATQDFEDTPEGRKLNAEHVQRSRLRIETRKWMAGKLRPKVYGEKQTTVLEDPDGNPVQFVIRDMTRGDA